MKQTAIIKLALVLKYIGLIWAVIGIAIVLLTNIILIGEYNIEVLFIPINPRDNTLIAVLLLAPLIPLFMSRVLIKKYNNKEVVNDKNT